MLEAAESLRTTDIPVAFPTETVYGLGADATRSAAVRGIYQAKKRPLDNPLIVHFSSLDMLHQYLHLESTKNGAHTNNLNRDDPIPSIYKPLIERFWPGPLTILLPNPTPSPFAPEVTTTLPSFGARIPSSPLARLLIHLAQTPLAAPSANASGLPSPTTAQHVESDLSGRISIILDGGPCGLGLESTVVDGLSSPPVVLRPGGVGIDEIRNVAGWEDTQIGYQDVKEGVKGEEAPRAPGMKYRHYAPRAQCVLFEVGEQIGRDELWRYLDGLDGTQSTGVVRTRNWERGLGLLPLMNGVKNGKDGQPPMNGSVIAQPSFIPTRLAARVPAPNGSSDRLVALEIWDVDLGSDLHDIARGLFSALRALDEKGVDLIFVEGISDAEGDLAAAIMNRLRKACDVR
jgi:L-threonylcarbamoyladenylate synthase